ncbi:hypothetical protein DYB32_001065 [Aphanomyces invadans]|uniref:Uncharacterized protein n=1 Tax=Aphanomyces invadans TaxID=157072 RepID=A0A418B7W1_9STRA|nr:hypothetical protein DYB32_001065 [Aphanomyces invadans]
MTDSTLQIVAGTYEGMLYGWEASTKDLTGKKPRTALKMIYGYPAHTECIKALAMMMEHDGKTLLTGGNDEMIKIYNVKKKVEVGILMQHKGAITCLEYYGKSHVLSGSADNTICIWRTSDWNCIHILGGHKLLAKISHPDITARIRSLQVVEKEDANEMPYIVLVSTNGVVQVYDLAHFSLENTSFDTNNAVEPVASTKVFGTALVTCLSACRMNVVTTANDSKPAKPKTKKPKQVLGSSEPVKSVVPAPKIVVEHEVTDTIKKSKRKSTSDETGTEWRRGMQQPMFSPYRPITDGQTTKKHKDQNHGPPPPPNSKLPTKKTNKKLNEKKPVVANWDDEEEEDEPAPVAAAPKPAAPTGPLKPKQLKKQILKEQEEKHKLEVAIARARAEDERNMTADELKAKQIRAIEHSDFENTLDAFGLSANPNVERKKVTGPNEVETLVTNMKLASLADHEELGSLVGKRLANSNAKYVVEFMKTLISHASNNLTADDMKDITTIVNVIKNDKIAAAKPKSKKKKITGKQGYAKVERSGGGGMDDFEDDGEDFDDFM